MKGWRTENSEGGFGEDISSRLERERALVFFIFERALADILGNGTNRAERRDARQWLFAPGSPPYEVGSANWYADLAEMEHVLYACQKVALAADVCQEYANQTSKTIGVIKRCWCERVIKARADGILRERRRYRDRKTSFSGN